MIKRYVRMTGTFVNKDKSEFEKEFSIEIDGDEVTMQNHKLLNKSDDSWAVKFSYEDFEELITEQQRLAQEKEEDDG